MRRCICAAVWMISSENVEVYQRKVNGVIHRLDGPCHSEVVRFPVVKEYPPEEEDNA